MLIFDKYTATASQFSHISQLKTNSIMHILIKYNETRHYSENISQLKYRIHQRCTRER